MMKEEAGETIVMREGGAASLIIYHIKTSFRTCAHMLMSVLSHASPSILDISSQNSTDLWGALTKDIILLTTFIVETFVSTH